MAVNHEGYPYTFTVEMRFIIIMAKGSTNNYMDSYKLYAVFLWLKDGIFPSKTVPKNQDPSY